MQPGLRTAHSVSTEDACQVISALFVKPALSVTFDLFILEIIFLFFKNTVKILKFRYTIYLFRNN